MPELLDPFPEAHFYQAAETIMVAEFTVMADCQAFPEGQIVASTVSQKPDHMAYWLRPREGKPTIVAYLICKPISLRGLAGSEAVRGWVAEQGQRKGVFVELMRAAAAAAGGMLVSDKQGMTEKAYASWMGARGFSKQLYCRHSVFVVVIGVRNKTIKLCENAMC